MRNLVSLFTVLLFACAVSLVRVASVSAQCPSNAVVNAGFEDGYSERGAGEVVVANGWTPWWQEGPHQ